jgi:hypothetical protein
MGTACRAHTADPLTYSFMNSFAPSLRFAPVAYEKDEVG